MEDFIALYNHFRFYATVRDAFNKFPDFFYYGHFYWQYTYEPLVPFEVISSGFSALVVPFQQLLEGPMEVLLCECFNDLLSQPLSSPQLSHNDSL